MNSFARISSKLIKKIVSFLKQPLRQSLSIFRRTKIRMSVLQMSSVQLACLRPCQIINELTETENNYPSLNQELLWVWNTVYYIQCGEIQENIDEI